MSINKIIIFNSFNSKPLLRICFYLVFPKMLLDTILSLEWNNYKTLPKNMYIVFTEFSVTELYKRNLQ